MMFAPIEKRHRAALDAVAALKHEVSELRSEAKVSGSARSGAATIIKMRAADNSHGW